MHTASRDPNRGRIATQFIRSLVAARGNASGAAAFASGRGTRWAETAGLLKAAVGASGADDFDNIGRTVGTDLLGLFRPRSILGRLAVTRVPFDVKMVRATAGTQAGFVALGDGIPLSALALAGAGTLPRLKVAGIAVVTNELARSADPTANAVIGGDLAEALALGEDRALVSSAAAVDDDTPAGLCAGIAGRVSSGSTIAAWLADLKAVLGDLVDGGSDLSRVAWVTSPATATSLRTMYDGGFPFPGVRTAGVGELLGLPQVASAAVEQTGSPAENFLIAVDLRQLWVAEDAAVEIETSDLASLEMSDAPSQSSDTPTASNMISMFQTESTAVKAVRYINWRLATTGAVQILRGFTN